MAADKTVHRAQGGSFPIDIKLVVDNHEVDGCPAPSRTHAVQEITLALRSFQAVLRQHHAGHLSDTDTLDAFYGILDHDEMNAALNLVERRNG